MTAISKLLENNRRWAARKTNQNPSYFANRANRPVPKYLIIGCSDLEVPVSELLGMKAGEVLTHTNVANLVVNSDMSLLSLLQYAVAECGIEDIMVCGHYRCGGVAAAMSHQQRGLIDSWLTHIRDVIRLHEKELLRIKTDEQRLRRVVELNVVEQVRNLAKINIIQNAVQSGKPLRLHGLVYDAATGLVKNLNVDTAALGVWASIYETRPAALVVSYAQSARPLAPVSKPALGKAGYQRLTAQ